MISNNFVLALVEQLIDSLPTMVHLQVLFEAALGGCASSTVGAASVIQALAGPSSTTVVAAAAQHVGGVVLVVHLGGNCSSHYGVIVFDEDCQGNQIMRSSSISGRLSPPMLSAKF